MNVVAGSRVTQYLAHDIFSTVGSNHYLDHSDVFVEVAVPDLQLKHAQIPPDQPPRYWNGDHQIRQLYAQRNNAHHASLSFKIKPARNGQGDVVGEQD